MKNEKYYDDLILKLQDEKTAHLFLEDLLRNEIFTLKKRQQILEFKLSNYRDTISNLESKLDEMTCLVNENKKKLNKFY